PEKHSRAAALSHSRARAAPDRIRPPVHDLEIEVLRRLRAAGRGERIVVGVSGGPDSCSLLAACAAVAPSLDIEIVAAHLDHGLRPESRADADFARALAVKLGVRFEEGTAAIATEGRGIEAAA